MEIRNNYFSFIDKIYIDRYRNPDELPMSAAKKELLEENKVKLMQIREVYLEHRAKVSNFLVGLVESITDLNENEVKKCVYRCLCAIPRQGTFDETFFENIIRSYWGKVGN